MRKKKTPKVESRVELARQAVYWRTRAEDAEAKIRRIANSAADLRGRAEQHIMLVDAMVPKGTDK